MTDSKEHTELNTEAFTTRIEDDAPEIKKRRIKGKHVALGALAIVAVSGASVATTLFFSHPGERGEGSPEDTGHKAKTVQTPITVESESPAASPDASESVTPEATASSTPEATQPVVTGFEIPAGLSAEKYGDELTQRISDWIMMGADDNFDQTWLKTFGTDAVAKLLEDTADANAQEVSSDLFANNSQSNQSLEAFKAKFLQLNRSGLDHYVHTYNSQHAEDTEPWSHSLTADSVEGTPLKDGGRTITISGTEHNDAAQNRVGDPSSSIYSQVDATANGSHFIYVFTTKIEDGTERIASWQNLPAN